MILYRIETLCPDDDCEFAVMISGCRTPEEAIEAGEALGRIHVKFEHPGEEDQLMFRVIDRTTLSSATTSANGRTNLKIN
jgi:hypothetical protein